MPEFRTYYLGNEAIINQHTYYKVKETEALRLTSNDWQNPERVLSICFHQTSKTRIGLYSMLKKQITPSSIAAHNMPEFQMGEADIQRLRHLPWKMPLSSWPQHGVTSLQIRRGESRHPVLFVECDAVRYAIKETTPHMAQREIRNLREIERRGLPVLVPIGSVSVTAPPLRIDGQYTGGASHYMSGDRGYTVTALAPRVIPHSLLFRLPFRKRTKQRLLGAIAILMVELHEHGVYWGDPSLANVLIRIDGRRILAIMADAETTELFPRAVEQGLRQQDLALFHESLTWQAEDLRQARGIADDAKLLSEKDYDYFERRYRWLSREHAQFGRPQPVPTFSQIERFLTNMSELGFSLLSTSEHTLQTIISVSPGWYIQRVYELLGMKIPPKYASRFYNMILGHQAFMRIRAGHDVSIEEAAHDWYQHYHLPMILLLRRILTRDQDPIKAYFAIMQHQAKLSKRAGYTVPLDEAILDWAMDHSERRTLGPVDPAVIATWWRERKPAIEVLEPPVIEGDQLAALLSENEQPLVHAAEPPLADTLEIPEGDLLDS